MKLILSLFLVLALISCKQKTEAELPESTVIALVGDEVITSDLLKAFLRANGIANADEQTINLALESLIDEMATANIARKKQLNLSGDQLNTFKYLKIKALANNARTDYLLDNKITEQEIKKEYNKVNKQTGGQQYRVHHLLYQDEVEAIKALDTIKTPEDFLAKEKEYLQSNPNKRGIGDLGWVILGQLPKNFRNKIPSLTVNSVLNTVVNSKYGAHIVFLQGKRKLQAPKLEEVKKGIVSSLQAKKLSKLKQLARVKAHVIIKQ